jgi:formylglycine-generating enzyme required for sulfatase activity
MLLQRAGTGTIPPPDFTPPNWTSLTKIWDAAPQQISPTVTLGPATVSLGHDDFEADDTDPIKSTEIEGYEFGWDNEHPKRDVYVEKFSIEFRPVTNGQFYDFYQSAGQKKVKLPATWVEVNGETCVGLKRAVRVVTKT